MKCLSLEMVKQYQDKNCKDAKVLLCSIYNEKLKVSCMELIVNDVDSLKEQFNTSCRQKIEKKYMLDPFFLDFDKYSFYITGILNKNTMDFKSEIIKIGENMLDFLDEDIKEVILNKKIEKLKKVENYKNTFEEYKKLKDLMK